MRIREKVKSFEPYEGGGESPDIRLDRNESPFDLPSELKSEVLDKLRKVPFNRYPSTSARPLRKKLARFLGLNLDMVVVGNGSDELIPYFIKLFDGDRIVVVSPTFDMYRFYGALEGLEVVEVPLKEDFQLPLSELKRQVQDARALILCSPNNPTGNCYRRKEIVELLETETPLILDEAYHEFAGRSQQDLLEDFDNLVLLRTFSKAFSLAGARVGYALASDDIIDYLLRIKPPYNLSTLAIKTAETVLEQPQIMEERVQYIVEERNRMISELKEYCYPSQANFVLMNLDLHQYLKKRGILVREFSDPLADKIRVTVGERSANDKLIEAIKDAV
ncbi:MAG: histidinol-phosphate transaminase [Candidatus Acetothermia bacterium]